MTEPSQYFKGRTVQEQMNEVIGYVDARAAEVATTAIASDVAQVHQDKLDADADAQAAAASAAAAAGTLANAVKKTGEASQSIAGDIAVSGNLSGGVVTGTKITAPTPVNNTDAANKKYVDDADALLIPITDINQYAVGLTGNQQMTGVKCVNNFFNYMTRITGTNCYELLRMDYVTDVHIYYTAYSRYGGGIGKLDINVDANDVTMVSTNVLLISYSNDAITSFFAYKDGTKLVVCVGNITSANNSISISINGVMSGAGIPRDIDISNIGTSRTQSALSAKVLQ